MSNTLAKRAVLVEDSPVDQRLISTRSRECGFEVVPVIDGLQGLDAAAATTQPKSRSHGLGSAKMSCTD